jgi:aminoglycoside phosphotransferase (APT) family kinase protein
MTRIRMHADEVFTDAALVRRLLAAQFPHWAHLPIEPVSSYGTDQVSGMPLTGSLVKQ